jgi:hypothetical protein
MWTVPANRASVDLCGTLIDSRCIDLHTFCRRHLRPCPLEAEHKPSTLLLGLGRQAKLRRPRPISEWLNKPGEDLEGIASVFLLRQRDNAGFKVCKAVDAIKQLTSDIMPSATMPGTRRADLWYRAEYVRRLGQGEPPTLPR